MENTRPSTASSVSSQASSQSPSDDSRPNEDGMVDDSKALSRLTVVKRNGTMTPFRRERIASAIDASMRATHHINSSAPLTPDLHSQLQEVSDQVVLAALEKAKVGASLTVEGIQDLVEIKLMECGHHDVARDYIVYRDQHKQLRADSPRNIRVLRRDGQKEVRFNPMKIASAIESCFRSTRDVEGMSPREVIQSVNVLTNKVVNSICEFNSSGVTITVETIQDEVEKQLMSEGYYPEAKNYILYRSLRAKLREGKQAVDAIETVPETLTTTSEANTVVASDLGQTYEVTEADGSKSMITDLDIKNRITYAAEGLDNIDVEEVFQETVMNFYQGIQRKETDQAAIMAARAKVEKEPNYSYLVSRLLLDEIYREVIGQPANSPEAEQIQREYFTSYLEFGIEVNRLSPKLREFDVKKITAALDFSRDQQFTYLGMQTIYDRYLQHHEDRRIETPQIFWMRVAMGLALEEGEDKNERAIEFYNLLSQFLYVSSTPTLFNSGTCHSQMSSCYLSTVSDDLSSIFKLVSDDAQLSKWAGGLGNDWTNIRATGSMIKGTNGRSQGIIPFLKVANDTAVAVNQGGKRKGAMCAYLETWHLDIEDFLELRKNTGDERRRTHDMNTANWIPDLFMKRVVENGSWTMFSPSDVPDLHDLYGKAFEDRYQEYEAMTETGEIQLFKKVEATMLWRKMLSMLFETAHPWITFKDPSNLRSPQDHVGVVHSSNLCTEILLNTSPEETAVCNLGSLNLPKHLTESGEINRELLAKSIKTAMRMLDNVININFYPTKEAEHSNLQHRPVGLGIMGFQDCLYAKKLSYASPAAVEFADNYMEEISYQAILASSQLAGERGAYPSYKGSKWDRGMLPIDSLALLIENRGSEYCDFNADCKLDWAPVRESIKKNGMRNSNTMAIAPTATISNISGVTQSIEPAYKHLFAKSNLSGEFIVINDYLVKDLKELGMWDAEMIDDLKYFDGSILEVERIPDHLKQVYLTAFEIDPDWIVECGARRQKWIDMGQSLNLYMAEPSGKKLHDMYMSAWKKGLKTTYYLRSLGATQIEKSTTDTSKRGGQPRWMKNQSASTKSAAAPALSVPKETENLDGECESCQ